MVLEVWSCIKSQLIEWRRGRRFNWTLQGRVKEVGTFNLPPHQLGLTYEIPKFFNGPTNKFLPLPFKSQFNRWIVFRNEKLFKEILFFRKKYIFLGFITFNIWLHYDI